MEQAELELAVVSLEIMEFVPDILALGVTAGSFVVLAAGLLVGCFKTLIKIMGGERMKKLFRSRWTRLTLALCMSMVLLSTAAYAAEDTTGGGTSASVISAFLLCLSLLLGLISPKLEARAFAFAPPAVAAVAAAFLGACGLKVVVDGMDREGLQDAMYKLLKEFLDTELGGITIEEWLGSAWDMTVTLGKIFLGHSLADKLNAFARWVAGKYGAQVGENEVYNEQISFFPDGTQLIFGFLPKL